jgi:hypothetical protein
MTEYRVIDGRVYGPTPAEILDTALEQACGRLLPRKDGGRESWFPLDLNDHPDVREAWENYVAECGVKLDEKQHRMVKDIPDCIVTLVKRECEQPYCKNGRLPAKYDRRDRQQTLPKPCPACANNETPGYNETPGCVNLFKRTEK